MPTPNINGNKHANATAAGTAGQLSGDEDAGGGGESEPSNDPKKASLNLTNGPARPTPQQNGPNVTSATHRAPATSPVSSSKSPKSPNRPQITLEITPASPSIGPASSNVRPLSSAISDRQRPSAASVSSPHEAVQTWVQSQGSGKEATSPAADYGPAKGQGPSKRDSLPANSPPPLRNRRPSESSQKSGKDISRPPSAAGYTSGGEGKFSLKDILSTGPKLTRRNSTSSRKSVSSGKGGSVKGGSTAGDSALESKYGIYGKMAVGKGATSVVRLAHKWDRTEDKLYAVKEFRPKRNKESQKDYVKKLTSEFCISSALRHPNVVETVDLMQDQEGKWCEVMEFCPGGDLYNAIRKGGMSPAEVECCFKQILTGIGYLHAQGVAHRDIKPENLFFDARGQVKVGDFGASTVFRLPWETTIHKSSGLCGSEPYIAPEQFTQPNSYDARLVDIWACGIVYYCLHFQELPWSSAQASDKIYAEYSAQCATPALSRENAAPYPKTIQHLSPRACRPVLRRMLEPKPELRVNIEDVLKHPWIAQIEVCTDPGVTPKHIHPAAIAAAAAGGIVSDK
ncbi:Pkinase-domain-containing protein [Serendipita vermifera]|nr:Pkinase-domain-containing protein [Serendipita vermifera]